VPLIDRLRREPDLCIGDNEPYSGKNRHGYTIETHAYPRDLPNTLIEVRQDLIETTENAIHWAERLADCLAPFLPETGRGGPDRFSQHDRAAAV
jgi:predicted N-formylglutamate amidohydrolase